MSTQIRDEFGIHELTLTQYYGGDDRGVCLQITGENCDRKIGWVGVTVEEARIIVTELREWIKEVK